LGGGFGILGLHWLLQHLRVKICDRLQVGVFEVVFDHFASDIVEHEAGRLFHNSFLQPKMFLHHRYQLNLSNKVRKN
jgi:hypothetical protein